MARNVYQQVFNKVIKHLVKQNCKATDWCGRCKYRGDNGTSCAVGCLISDKYYDESIEGNSAETAVDRVIKSLKVKVDDIHKLTDLLESLQVLHDQYMLSYERVEFIAREFNLTVPKQALAWRGHKRSYSINLN